MEITLEKIELVKDRTGVSYKEAKEALEKNDGNVVDAIIYIEDSIDESSKQSDSKTGAVIDTIKGLIKKGNVSKLVIKKDDEIILNLPVSIGVIGTVVFPWVTVAATVAAFGTKCKIELIKDDGEIINVSNKAGEAFDVAKSKGGVIIDEVKDRSKDVWDVAKDKGKDAWDVAKDKGKDAWDVAKDKGKDALDVAIDKGKDAWDVAKDKATNALKKDKDDEIIEVSDFGDLDLSDVDFSELEDEDE